MNIRPKNINIIFPLSNIYNHPLIPSSDQRTKSDLKREKLLHLKDQTVTLFY